MISEREGEDTVTTEAVMFSLLRAEISGGTVSEEVKASLSEEMLAEVYGLAKKHDLAHIVGDALSKLGLLGDNEISRNFKKAAMQAVYRYVQLNSEYQKICKTFEKAQIPFIPLKGSVLRNYYPEPWMRTSCDIDILIHETDVQQAIDALSEKLQYKYSSQWFYEYSLFSPNGVHLELHCNTIEKVDNKASEAVLETVWEMSDPENGFAHKQVMTDEMFYFYHIVHMAKHFLHGGCGIRPFLDLWILNHRVESNQKERYALLSKGAMMKFAAAAEKLSEVWFGDLEPDSLSCQLAHFVINGGTYGNMENNVIINQTTKGSRLQYILSRIFMPYDTLQYTYPVLQKCKWLYPLFLVVRWFRMLFCGGAKRSIHELKTNAEISSEQITSTADLLKNLGL